MHRPRAILSYVRPQPRRTSCAAKADPQACPRRCPQNDVANGPPSPKACAQLGALPEWNLTDLYPAMDAPELKRDLARAETDCAAFEEAYKGKLADAAADGRQALAEAVKRYEALDDLLGRLISYAGLVYAGNTTDPVRAKFYGDVQEKITAASLHLLFFTLELNRIDDAALEAAMRDPALGHYRPWIEDVRKEKPYQLEDRVEELFHEKSMTGAAPGTGCSTRRSRRCASRSTARSCRSSRRSTCCRTRRAGSARPRPRRWRKTFKENLRAFTLITNTLAKDKEISDRWRGFKDIADARHLSNRVEPEVVEALVAAVRDAYPRLSHRYYALKAKWFGKKRCRTGTATRRCRRSRTRTIAWDEARDTVLTAYGAFSPEMADDRRRFFDEQLDRCAGAARQAARRLRASDRAVGASLCAAQLSGQAARRDDARA